MRARAIDVMVRPLFQRGFPLEASSTYNLAGPDRCRHCAAPRVAGPARCSPLDTATTIPLTTSGASGDTRFGDRHAGARASRPSASTSVNATMLPAGASPLAGELQALRWPPGDRGGDPPRPLGILPRREPAALARRPTYFAVTCSGVWWSAPPRAAASSR